MGTIFVLRGGNFIPTYSKVLTFQQAKKYVKRETFKKSSKRIFLSRFGKKRPYVIFGICKWAALVK